MATKKRALKLPPVLVCLGQLIELRCGDKLFKWAIKDKMMLYSNNGGNQLIALCPKTIKFTKAEFMATADRQRTEVDKGVKLYERWHEYEASKAQIAKPPKGFLYQLGRASMILYRSDKWTGTQTRYVHEFKKPPICWASNTKSAPKVLILTGGQLTVKKEGITG